MTAVLPIGYLTILQAADLLLPAMYAGVPNLPVVRRLRKEGLDVGDGRARDRAIAELWKAVDAGTLRALGIGGRPRRIIRLDSEVTKSVPTLRSPRGRGFTFLRQSNPTYHELASEFGPLLHRAALAFREMEVQKLARRLMRARRIAQKATGQKNPRGRPSRMRIVQPVISHLVAQQKWNSTMGMKALTREVNRVGKWPQDVSQDTVTRALDLLHEQTKDRRFERVRHKRRPRRKAVARPGMRRKLR
jgi:hypothetical protein